MKTFIHNLSQIKIMYEDNEIILISFKIKINNLSFKIKK